MKFVQVLKLVALCLCLGAVRTGAQCSGKGNSCESTANCCVGLKCVGSEKHGKKCQGGRRGPPCSDVRKKCDDFKKQCCKGFCVSVHCASCLPEGGICATDVECCSGKCESGTCRACIAEGGTGCVSNGDCCDGNGIPGACKVCILGTCYNC